jgi:hypothetical protein
VKGDITSSNTAAGCGGDAIININGTGTQNFTGGTVPGTGALPQLTINKSSGTLNLANFPAVSNNFTYTAGTINAGTSTFCFTHGSTGSYSITGSLFLNNIGFIINTSLLTVTVDAATTLTATGNLTIAGAGNLVINTGNINVNGNIDPGTSTCYIVNNLTITGSFSVYTLSISPAGNTTLTVASGSTITATNLLDLENGSNYITINTGTIAVQGDIVDNNSSLMGGGTGTILINGTGAQNLTTTGIYDQGRLPSVTINKPSGTLTLPSMLTVRGNWTYTSGTLDPFTNNSTVVFRNTLNITGSHTLNNVIFDGSNNHTDNNTATVNTGTILTVTGTLSTTGAFNVFINTPVPGSTAAAKQGLMPYITIRKTTGTLTFTGIISESRDWTYVSGTVDASTNSSTVVFGGNNLTITNGNLTINGTGVLAAGANTINLMGNWIDRGTAGFTEGTSTVNFNGTSLQTVTSPGGGNFTNLNVNNTGAGIQLVNSATVATTLMMTQGDIDLNGNALILGLSVANNGTLAYTAGSMAGTGSFTRWFKPVTIADGSVAGLFPMGTTSDSRAFYVAAPSVPPTTGGTIAVAFANATSNTTTPTYMDGASTIMVRKDLNWTTTTGNGLAGGTFDLEVQGTGFGAIGSASDL